MSPKNLRCLPLAAAAMVVCMSAQAEYTLADGKLRLSGFGTVGVARTTNDQASICRRVSSWATTNCRIWL